MSNDPIASNASPRLFSRLGYFIFSLVLAAAALEFGSFLVVSAYHLIHPDNNRDLSSASPAYSQFSWASEFWKEEHLRWNSGPRINYLPFLVWGEQAWHGKYINVDDSALGPFRRTTNPVCDQPQARVIWMFGGSTVFGTGVPDAMTIPSYLSQTLNSQSATCVAISNFGVEGYLTNQELILLINMLKTGERPDIVIFYDGVNDSDAAVSPGIPGAHLGFERVKSLVEGSVAGKLDFLRSFNTLRLAKAVAKRLRPSGFDTLPASEITARAAAALDNYQTNIRIVGMLGREYNFKTYCFWQPSLASGHKPLVPFEEQLWNAGPNFLVPHKILTATNQEAARRSAQNAGFVFLGNIFDSVSDPLYIDPHMHLGPQGNQIVADAIAKWIQGTPAN
jgi:lysophospholipase L1-like esterase